MPVAPVLEPVSSEIRRMIRKLIELGWPAWFPIEHAYEPKLADALEPQYLHEVWVTCPPTYTFRFVVFHAPACGCDAIPQELVLHG